MSLQFYLVVSALELNPDPPFYKPFARIKPVRPIVHLDQVINTK